MICDLLKQVQHLSRDKQNFAFADLLKVVDEELDLFKNPQNKDLDFTEKAILLDLKICLKIYIVSGVVSERFASDHGMCDQYARLKENYQSVLDGILMQMVYEEGLVLEDFEPFTADGRSSDMDFLPADVRDSVERCEDVSAEFRRSAFEDDPVTLVPEGITIERGALGERVIQSTPRGLDRN